MNAWSIHINGRVQGVGFRPFIKQLADAHNLDGWVKNTAQGVRIHAEGDLGALQGFIQSIEKRSPLAAVIGTIRKEPTELLTAQVGFEIRSSSADAHPSVNITPDLALCTDCRQELRMPSNRRSAYPFITCTNCGPRYSIIDALPYDRERTRMRHFQACPTCDHEYGDSTDRRFHSQTNSCHACGVHLIWLDHAQHKGDPIVEVVDRLRSGQIVAVKGTGGFLLLADATIPEVVQALRQRKARPAKPLACLYPNLDLVKDHYSLREVEAKALSSQVAPIVLLSPNRGIQDEIATDAIAPALDRIGVMLPSNALLTMIAEGFGKPLIATSGNVSGAPICYTNDRAINHLTGIADVILGHDLQITTPLDDSVVRFTANGKQIIHRRSRGLAPEILLPLRIHQKVLALGAEMKSSFALATGKQLVLSQALGNTSTYDAQLMYKQSLDHMLKLMDTEATHVICDLHPDYFTSQWAAQWKDGRGIELERVQHHKAHLAALLYEKGLLDEQAKPILGFVWDGTGYGEDGHIWGSESFLVNASEMKRVGHLSYVPFLAHHRMMKEPPVALLAFGGNAAWVNSLLPEKDVEMLQQFYANESLQSSSMGRLFDAVAAMLLRIKRNRYEGEAAMRLQCLASTATDKTWQPFDLDYSAETMSVHAMLQAVHDALSDQKPARLALRFHQSLVEWVRAQAERHEIHQLAFSGGVFQNALLIELLETSLGNAYELFFHEILPSNDESVALGQLVYSTYFNPTSRNPLIQQEDVLSSTR